MSLTKEILRLLNSSRQGMTTHNLCKALDYQPGRNSLQCLLGQMINNQHVRTDGRTPCDGCGREHVVYRITDHGRIHLNDGAYETNRCLTDIVHE